jgi:PAS domain S-box-containing protein
MKYRHFFNNTFDLLAVLREGAFVETNSAWVTLTGYSCDELVDLMVTNIVHPDDQRSFAKALRCSSGKVSTARVVTKEGHVLWLEWRFTRDGEDTYVVARDITSTVRGEEKLGSYLIDLNEKRKELERSNQDLEHFAYVASHDLQTPLRKVKNFTQHLMNEYGHCFEDEMAQKYTRFIVEGAETAQSIVDGLLKFSRTGRSLTEDTFSMNTLVDRVLDVLSCDLEEKRAHVSIGKLPTVKADKVLLAQVLQNIVGNAIKFRHPDRDLEIVIESEEGTKYWTISISDNGVGFPTENADHIFGIFKRLRRDKNGTGLGLALSRRIIERHGGKVWARSTEGVGSTFFFTLPKQE